MRLAIIAASSYEENGQLAPIPNAEIDVELFGGRLAEADAGFTVHAFSAQRGLAEGVEALIASLGARPEALIFYFWGYALVSEERGPTLLLDGPRLSPFSLARLRRQLCELSQVALVVLDATLAEGSAGSALDAVRTMGAALSGGDSSISSLIAVRTSSERVALGPPPFTGLLQMILDAETGSATALTPETLFRSMQAEEVMFADIPAAGCFLGQGSFVLIPGVAELGVAPAANGYDEAEDVTASRSLHTRPPPPPPPPLPRPEVRRSVAPPPPRIVPGGTLGGSAALSDASSTAAPYRAWYEACERAGDRDGAYRAALCLEALGEADINESLLATTHRPEALQAVRATLTYSDWNERLCAGCDEPQITALLRAIGPALAPVGFQHARRRRRVVELPEEARQDIEMSTTTLAKTLHWVSRLLSVPARDLYVLSEVSGAVELVPGPERPLLTCARALGSGKSMLELVGLWSRELSFARPEQAALCYFEDAAQLSELVFASLAVGGAISMRSITGDAKRLTSGLKREVRGAALDALRAAAQAFPVQEARACAEAFVQSAELVAQRVALVASGDLELTLDLAERFPRRSSMLREDLRQDLFAFTISREFGEIRAGLGIALS